MTRSDSRTEVPVDEVPGPADLKHGPTARGWLDRSRSARWLVPAAIVVVLAGSGAVLFPQFRSGKSAMASVPPPQPAPIDGARAFRYLQAICKLGPHTAGSDANTRQRELMAAHFKKHGAVVREQSFTGIDPQSGHRLPMANLIASWHPERTDRFLLAAHYDTRPHPDQEVDPARYRLPFIGANDPGSGMALLMEIAHHLNDMPTTWGVDLVLLDGEELVYGQVGEYFLGSKYFARDYQAGRRSGKIKHKYAGGILFDMVGGKNLVIEREPFSFKLARSLQDQVWSVADKLGERAFSRAFGREVMDDHLPLNDGGIPTIDLIDFDYPHWHLASDLPENCSGESLAKVGRVVTAWLNQPRTTKK